MAAVILARLVTVVRTVIDIAKITLWTDSATVLHWLQTPVSHFKPFVSTRVQEINERVPEAPDCFRYIKSSLNPADALTKPIQNFKLSKWHHGPNFLFQASEHWPSDLPPKTQTHACDEEKKKSSLNVPNVSSTDNFETELLKRISSWPKLLRVTAWILRPVLDTDLRLNVLSANELRSAKLCLFRLAQSDLRKPESQIIKDKFNLEPSTNEKGLMRIHRRLDNLSDCESTHPIALPAKSKVTKLCTKHMHQSLGHLGYRVVITNLRQNDVYILRGKQLLKSIASKCIKCRIARLDL